MSRLELEGELQRLRQKRLDILLKGRNRRDAILRLLGSPNTPVSEVDARGVKSLADELYELHLEIKEILDQIKEIEKELN